MTKPPFRRILATTAICLAAGAIMNSCQEIEDGGCNVTGEKAPNDWIPTVPKKVVRFSQPNGWQVRTTFYDLSKTASFAAYCGQEVQFSPACAIRRKDYAGGIDYTLIDHIPLPGGVIDLYSTPVQKGRLLAVRGKSREEAPEGTDAFTVTARMVEALIEVQHPDATVNQGGSLYLVYNLGHVGTKEADAVYTNIKRAPWEPTDAPETRSIISLFEQIDKEETPAEDER